MSDIYKTPSSELIKAKSLEGFGSLERGIAGQFEFSIGGTIKEAWEKVSGSKGKVWLTLLLYMVIAVISMAIINFGLSKLGLQTRAIPGQPVTTSIVTGMIISQILGMLVLTPLGVGMFMVGLKIAVGAPVTALEILKHYDKTLTLFFTTILMYIILAIGFALFIIPGIYLAVAYYFALPLIVEKDLGPWQALEASRKAISKCWFRFFFYGLIMLLLLIIATIPLLIGTIWVLPMAMIGIGIVYRNIFGFEGNIND